jgi:uncharacterized protein
MIIIDAFAFCRNGELQAGKLNLVELSRLRAECVSGDGEVEWELAGTTHASGHPALQLSIRASMHLMCQRCLTPFVFQIQSGSTILLATNEKVADEIDASLEDEDVEVVVVEKAGASAAGKTFDIMTLIEDEALLAIPLSPKHEVCPKDKSSAEKLDAFAKVKKESPFAALKDQLMLGETRLGKTKSGKARN